VVHGTDDHALNWQESMGYCLLMPMERRSFGSMRP